MITDCLVKKNEHSLFILLLLISGGINTHMDEILYELISLQLIK
jgi:hypothetical protein